MEESFQTVGAEMARNTLHRKKLENSIARTLLEEKGAYNSTDTKAARL